MPGVGMTPARSTSTPDAQRPAERAAVSMEPEMRVSIPIRKRCLPLALQKYAPAARPSWYASSGINVEFTSPRTPSVPNNVTILFPPNNFLITFVFYREGTISSTGREMDTGEMRFKLQDPVGPVSL